MLALSFPLFIAMGHCCMSCGVQAFYDVKELQCFFVVVVVLRAIIRHLMYGWISSSLSLFFLFKQLCF